MRVPVLPRAITHAYHDGGGSLIESGEYRTGDVRLDASKYQRRHPDFIPVEEVEGLRLDDIITNTSVLKIDVEGAEIPVLKSGMKALKAGLVNLAVVEVTASSINEVVSLLDTVGFDCFIYGQRAPITNPHQFDRRVGNVLCLRRQSHFYEAVLARMLSGEL